MFEQIIDFVFSYWGLIGLVALFILEFFREREVAKARVKELIFLAEEKAQKKVLKSGQQKFDWVVEQGYQYLPPIVQLFMTKEAYQLLVQSIFDRIKAWAINRGL